jgi:hypothetical protein
LPFRESTSGKWSSTIPSATRAADIGGARYSVRATSSVL